MAKDALTDEERLELERQKQAKLSKFKLDKHHKIERFGVIVTALTSCMVILLVVMFIKYRKDMKILVSDTPMYTKTIATSLTQNTGQVKNIYRNEKGDKVAILVKFDSMEGLKTDAKNYNVWVTGFDAYYDCSVSGGVYLYGQSGYMALCFYSPTGFPNQVADIIVRSNESISAEKVTDQTPKDDSSFAKYDQFRIRANLGAKKMNVASFFDTTDGTLIDSRKLYDEAVLLKSIKTLKKECNSTLASMELELRRMDYYEGTLTEQGIQILERDEKIRGDKVVEYTGPEVKDAESKMMDNGQIVTGQEVGVEGQGKDKVQSEADALMVDEEGNTIVTTEQESIVVDADDEITIDPSEYKGLWQLETDYVCTGGYDFEWQIYDVFNIKNHYLDTERGDLEDFAYLNMWKQTLANADDKSITLPSKWVKKDGSEFIYKGGDDVYRDAMDDEINSNIEALKKSYITYYGLKRNYQTNLLPKFMDYEYNESSFTTKTTVNAEKNAINVWQKYDK
jgi:hypothetical protein